MSIDYHTLTEHDHRVLAKHLRACKNRLWQSAKQSSTAQSGRSPATLTKRCDLGCDRTRDSQTGYLRAHHQHTSAGVCERKWRRWHHAARQVPALAQHVREVEEGCDCVAPRLHGPAAELGLSDSYHREDDCQRPHCVEPKPLVKIPVHYTADIDEGCDVDVHKAVEHLRHNTRRRCNSGPAIPEHSAHSPIARTCSKPRRFTGHSTPRPDAKEPRILHDIETSLNKNDTTEKSAALPAHVSCSGSGKCTWAVSRRRTVKWR